MANLFRCVGGNKKPSVMSTGYQYIELPLYADDYPIIKAKVMSLYKAGQGLYIGDVWTIDGFSFYIENDALQFRYTRDNIATISSPIFNKFVDIEMDYSAGTLKYNGTTYGGIQKTQLHNAICIFGIGDKTSIFAVEEMQIYKNNELYMNLIPLVDESGQGYLYDTIGQQSYFSNTNISLIHNG